MNPKRMSTQFWDELSKGVAWKGSVEERRVRDELLLENYRRAAPRLRLRVAERNRLMARRARRGRLSPRPA